MRTLTVVAWLFFTSIAYCQIADSNKAGTIEMMAVGQSGVLTENIVWYCGPKGYLANTIDHGKTIRQLFAPGFEKRDFIEIEALDDSNVVVVAKGWPALVIKSKDAGQTWKAVFSDSTKGASLFNMAFANNRKGVVSGNPYKGKPYMILTVDGGDSWTMATARTNWEDEK